GLEARVRFLGERTDVPALMGAADIYSQGNRGPEGFGLTFVEAFCSGLPVVSSGIGAATEVIDERSGILVPPEDPAALAGALRTLIEDAGKRQQMGQAARARAIQLCDPGRQLNRLYGLLVDIAMQGRRA